LNTPPMGYGVDPPDGFLAASTIPAFELMKSIICYRSEIWL